MWAIVALAVGVLGGFATARALHRWEQRKRISRYELESVVREQLDREWPFGEPQ